ncbi:MAG: hypothetical protein NTX03_12720 [Bacteroidetes bacterium]|nr:hypothetical protein [Bacteroidota bacterium]
MQELKRNYDYADSALVLKVSGQITSIRRDATEFLTLGVTATNVNDYETENDDFLDFITDDEQQGDVGDIVEAKDDKKAELIKKIKFVGDRALNKFGAKSAKYRAFGVVGLDHFTEKELLFAGKKCHRQGVKRQGLLAGLGVSNTVLTELSTLITEYFDLLDQVEDANEDRNNLTEERILEGNALHTKYVDFNAKGQLLWAAVSEAKANDYVETASPSGDGFTTVNLAAGETKEVAITKDPSGQYHVINTDSPVIITTAPDLITPVTTHPTFSVAPNFNNNIDFVQFGDMADAITRVTNDGTVATVFKIKKVN